jgi:hypothetical protein
MKKLILISILALSTICVKAYFEPQTLYSLILNADKIVYGQIIAVDSTTFTLKVEGSITGDTGVLTIEKFEDWTCGMRWTKYRLKQTGLFFLKKYNGRLNVMGGGNEGELPIFKNEIYVNGLSLSQNNSSKNLKNKANKTYRWEDFDKTSFEVHGGRFYGVKMDLRTFLQTIDDIQSCFKLNSDQQTAELICSVDKIDRLLIEDKIFRWTYRELIK